MHNGAEYFAGTDPTNAADVLKVRLANRDGRLQVELETRAAQGEGYEGRTRFYDLFDWSNLRAPVWRGIPDYSNLPGVDGRLVYTNTPDAASPRFFRGAVRLEQTVETLTTPLASPAGGGRHEGGS